MLNSKGESGENVCQATIEIYIQKKMLQFTYSSKIYKILFHQRKGWKSEKSQGKCPPQEIFPPKFGKTVLLSR